MDSMNEWLIYLLPGLIALAVFLDAIAGYLPDKWVPYFGMVRRLVGWIIAMGKRSTGSAPVWIVLAILPALLCGCSGIAFTANGADSIEAMAVSVGAKALGQEMAKQGIVWTPMHEQFYEHVSKNGLSIDSATIVGQFAFNAVPELYREEAEGLARLVGFTVTANGWAPNGDNYSLLMAAITGFRAAIVSCDE